MYETIEVTHVGPVANVALNRPDVRNALNPQMMGELTDAFGTLASRDDIRVVVLSGEGASFSAGADVNWMRSSMSFTAEQNIDDALAMSDTFQAIDSLPKPVVARVHGAALGGGMGLMAVCDVVVAAEDTVFGFTEGKLGIIPAVISRFVIPKIGESWARSLYLTAERFGPELARQIGLVHWIAPADNLNALVAEKVDELLSSGPEAVTEGKRLIADAVRANRDDLRLLTAHRIATIRVGAEGQEGLRAFLEKRKPAWRNEEA